MGGDARRTVTVEEAPIGVGRADARTSRRSFFRTTGGYAAGVAGAIAAPTVLLEAEAQAATPAPRAVPNPTTPVPSSPVMAYVHDAKAGTVVIMSGTSERTVQDHELVRRLLHAPTKARPKRRRRHSLTTTASKRGY